MDMTSGRRCDSASISSNWSIRFSHSTCEGVRRVTHSTESLRSCAYGTDRIGPCFVRFYLDSIGTDTTTTPARLRFRLDSIGTDTAAAT